MSENIQSISQGTFTIGQTSATNFVAGPGIKIDEPSAGTVRIGNDETVLYEGTGQFGLNLSDSIYNYDKIAVSISRLSPTPEQYFYTKDISASGGYFNTNYISMSTPSSTAEMYCFTTPWTILNNGNTISAVNKSFGITLNLTANSMYYFSKNASAPICRVIGINRISGSDA